MNQTPVRILRLSVVLLLAFAVAACTPSNKTLTPDTASLIVPLTLSDYTPQFGGTLPAYKGKTLCLSNIRNDARNTTNFSYYSKDNRVKYSLSNKANTPMQLIPSFFWYAYQKGFGHAGLTVVDRCTPDVPELWIIFRSFNDEELKFTVTLLENGETIFHKDLTIIAGPAAERSPEKLQARAYRMIDLTVKTILGTPEFQAGFL